MDEKKKTAIILLFLSDFKSGRAGFEYIVDGERFEGIGTNQTNYAPTQYLLRKAVSDGNRIEKIVCITTDKVINEKVEDKTAFEHYEDMLKDVCAAMDNMEMPQIIPIKYESPSDATGKIVDDNEAAMRIYQSIADIVNALSDTQIDMYVDYTGGFRDISYLMTTIIRYLEFRNVLCRCIVYSKPENPSASVNEIHDIGKIYDMGKVINGVNDFVTTGNVEQLSVIYNDMGDTAVNRLLEALDNFSDAISLCDVRKIISARQQIDVEFSSFEDRMTDGEDIYVEMFKSLIPIIKEKMYLDRSKKNDKSFDPSLISWCIDNRLLQQAITIYTEKIPDLYFSEFKELSGELNKCTHSKFYKKGTTKIMTKFYMTLYMCVADGFEVWKLKKMVSDACVKFKSPDAISRELRRYKNAAGHGSAIGKALAAIVSELNEYVGRVDVCRNFDRYGNFDFKGYKGFLCEMWKSTPYYVKLLYNEEYQAHGETFESRAYAVERMYKLLENKNSEIRLKKELTACGIDSEEKLTILKDILETYIILKIARNRANHASEDEYSKDEINAVKILERCSEYATSKKKAKTLDFKYDTLKRVIEKGVKVVEEM